MIDTSNVMHNSLLDHNNLGVNAIKEWLKETIKKKVSQVKMPMKFILKALIDMRFLLSQHSNPMTQSLDHDNKMMCKFHEDKVGHTIEECVEFK